MSYYLLSNHNNHTSNTKTFVGAECNAAPEAVGDDWRKSKDGENA